MSVHSDYIQKTSNESSHIDQIE